MTIVKFTDLLYGCHILGVWMDWVLMIKYRCNSPPEIVCRPYAEVWGRYEILRGVTADRPFFFGINLYSGVYVKQIEHVNQVSGTASTSNHEY